MAWRAQLGRAGTAFLRLASINIFVHVLPAPAATALDPHALTLGYACWLVRRHREEVPGILDLCPPRCGRRPGLALSLSNEYPLTPGVGYGLLFDLSFFLRNLSVVGGLLMVLSDSLQNKKKLFAGLPSVSETDRRK